jgi:hypothetical protein
MLPTKFRFIWLSGFRGEDFKKSANQKQELTMVILVSDWLISKKSSPLKPLGQMNRNLVGSILGRSSISFSSDPMFVNGSELNEQSL